MYGLLQIRHLDETELIGLEAILEFPAVSQWTPKASLNHSETLALGHTL